MIVVAQVVVALAGLLHVVIFVLESVLWARPSTWRRFGLASQADADTTRPMAFNQGFYNLFLAVGALLGAGLLGADGATGTVGATLAVASCGSMALAAGVLASGGAKYLRPAAVQFVPSALAVVLTLVAVA